MGFVWDRRKIKMLYSRTMSEMSGRIVCPACVENLEGVEQEMRWSYAQVCVYLQRVLLPCAIFIKPSLHPVRSMNKSSEYNTGIRL